MNFIVKVVKKKQKHNRRRGNIGRCRPVIFVDLSKHKAPKILISHKKGTDLKYLCISKIIKAQWYTTSWADTK
jgi:hypothetical protein